ncbi:MAG TPA: porin [Methylomirabilota bacterium]|nr:porin [Methylomirabilota bacterium]
MNTSLATLLVLIGATLLTAQPVVADDRDDRIRALEKRVEQLEKLLLTREAKPAAPGETPQPAPVPKAVPTLSVGSSGFIMRSADTNFALRIRGLIQFDSRWSDDENIDDSFVLRRARPIIEGTVFRDFDFRLTPEFGGSSVALRDAWLNYRYSPALQLRMGKMKPPGSLERWQSVANGLFIERSPVSLLWPVRDLGFMLHGELWPGDGAISKSLAGDGLLNYDIGVFNGTGDARAAGNSDFDGDKTAAARLFFHPFLKSEVKPLQKFGVGVSGTYGEMQGAAGLPDDFTYRAGTTADGLQWRVGPQAYWYWGPFGVLGEHAISSQRLERNVAPFASTRAENSAWMVTASWMLTGEDATFRAVTPRKNFDPRAREWGALQAVVRYSYLDLDDDLFPTFANPLELPTRAASWGVGLNWYLNRNLRAAFDFNHTDFKGGQSGNAGDFGENVFSTRVQLAF